MTPRTPKSRAEILASMEPLRVVEHARANRGRWDGMEIEVDAVFRVEALAKRPGSKF